MHTHTIKMKESNVFDFIDALFTHGIDNVLDYVCTLSVFTLD